MNNTNIINKHKSNISRGKQKKSSDPIWDVRCVRSVTFLCPRETSELTFALIAVHFCVRLGWSVLTSQGHRTNFTFIL